MRYLLLSSFLLLAGIVTAASAEAPSTGGVAIGGAPAKHPMAVKRTIYLSHGMLEDLRMSNPERYAQVRRVMVAASQMCAPNAARRWDAANFPSASCSSMFLRTSFPPKRQVSFQIQDTLYVALVTVRDKPALRNAAPDELVPLAQKK